ncbi:MAG: transporter substrate-binding domain-containing protein [archaeon]
MNTKVVVLFVLVFASLLLVGCTTKEKIDYASFGLVEDGVLIVGSDIPYEPMEFYDENGELAGVDMDVIKEIATNLGLELEVVDYDWDALFEAVKGGEIDLAIAAITITPERSQEMLFSDPYFNGGQVIIVREGYEEISLPEDLQGKNVGVQAETTGEEEVLKYTTAEMVKGYAGFEVPEGATEAQIVSDLKSGTIDTIVVDFVLGRELVATNSELKIVGEPFTQEFYGIVTMKGNTALMNEVNNALRDLKRENMLEVIQDRWI